jgi:hypothetical protein
MDAASNDHSLDASLNPIIRRFCTVPNPLESYEQAQRRAHLDIAQLSTAAVKHELHVLRWWTWLRRPRQAWFYERIRRLEGELRGRR